MRRTAMLSAFFLAILLHSSVAYSQEQSSLVGAWFGTLEVGLIKLRIRLDIAQSEDGKLAGVVTSIDQGNAKLSCDSLEFVDTQLTFECQKVKAKFVGTWNEESEFKGTFTQMGQEIPLTLKLDENPDARSPNRPQTPKAPFPYEIREVEFENENADGVILAGTLTTPEGGGPFPAVILVSGSGPQDRDESIMGHKPFHVLADYLTRSGIAVLRFDDRGIGKSLGDFSKSTSADFATDAAAGIAFLATQPNMDKSRIGIVGHSEGGLIAAMLAAKNTALAHAVFLAGPGVNGDEILRSQTRALGIKSGTSTEEDFALIDDTLDLVKGGGTADDIIEMVDHFFDAKTAKSQSDENREEGEEQGGNQETEAAIQAERKATRAALLQFSSPWFRYYIDYDPQVDLKQAQCPILAMNGSKDLQVLADLNIPAIESALKSAPVQGHRVVQLDGLNHLFQTAQTGLPAEYAEIEETIAPEALEMVREWILAH